MDQGPAFGKLLRRYRLAAGLTQAALAEQAGLSLRGLSDLERGARQVPHPETVQRLADALQLASAEREALRAVRSRQATAGARSNRHRSEASLVAPVYLTSFVGRQREIGAVCALLDTARLVTLTGTGGIGKSRLALVVAEALVTTFDDRAAFVDLAALRDASLVPQAVADALSVSERPGRPLMDLLTDRLRQRHLLLVVDNCEHLLGACVDLVDALLRACPRLQVLATSRQRLGIAGEVTWRVPSLALPERVGVHSADNLAQYDAVQLFLERARSVLPGFFETEDNVRAVAIVCGRLDGMPLAIELAAAWVRVLAPEQIGNRLDDRFRLLSGGSQTVSPRQQTLRAAIAWSYDMLTPAEQLMFDRLAVFAGGWTLEAAEAVCTEESAEPYTVLDLLASLVDKSLVLVEAQNSGSVRYRLMETLRQFGGEQLRKRGQTEATSERHAVYYLAFAEKTERELYGPQQTARYILLQMDHDNLRAALRWYLERASPEAVRLAAAIWWFWHQHQLWTEGRDWLERVLALPTESWSDRTRVVALMGAGLMAVFQHDFSVARSRLDASAALARETGDTRTFGRARGYLGILCLFEGDPAAARCLFQESLEIARSDGDVWSQSTMLRLLASGAMLRRDHVAARSLLEESLASARASGDSWTLAMVLNTYGDLARALGEYEQAEAHYEESLRLFRARGAGGAYGGVLHNLGYVFLHRGNPGRARACLAEAMPIFRRMDDRRGLAECVTSLASVFAALGDAERATMLFGAAEHAFEAQGASPSPQNRTDADLGVTAARGAMNEPDFSAIWSRGRSMSLDQAATYALEDTSPT